MITLIRNDFSRNIALLLLAFLLYSIYNFIYLPSLGASYPVVYNGISYLPNIIFPDEGRFIKEAFDIHRNNIFIFNESRAWEMPLTAIIYSVFDVFDEPNYMIYAIRLFQSLLLLIQAVLAYKLAGIIFKDKMVANITLFVYLFYPFFVFYQGLLLSETIFITFLLAGYYFFYKWFLDNNSISSLYIAQLLFVLAVYTKGVLSFFPIILMVVTIFFIKNKSLIYKSKVLVSSLIIFVLLLSPWWIRNYTLFDRFVPFSTSASYVLYSGNNYLNTSGGGIGGKDVIDLAGAQKLSEIERMDLYQQEALNFIKNNPMRFIENAYKKFTRYWRLYPYAQEYNKLFYILVSIFSFGVVLAFSIYTLVVFRSNLIILLPILALIFYMTVIHMIYIASIRYRLPLEPFLIILATGGLGHLLRNKMHQQELEN